MSKRNVYKGHRYVPKIMGEWNQEETYEGLSIVTNKGTSYTSKKRVPVGIDILDEEYWVVTGNYNAQVENYRQEVREFDNRISDTETGVENNTTQLAQTNILNIKQFGVVGDGLVDDTNNFQKALNASKGKTLIIEGTENHYRITGTLVIPSDVIILGSGNPKIKYSDANTFASENAPMFELTDKENIVLDGLELDGNRLKQTTLTEWLHGINGLNSKKVEIKNCYIHSFSGDGIALSGPRGDTNPSNTNKEWNMHHNMIANNGRNGISLIHAESIEIYLNTIKEQHAYVSTLGSGIDLEPNHGGNAWTVKNVNIFKNHVEDNNVGIQLYGSPIKSITVIENISVINNTVINNIDSRNSSNSRDIALYYLEKDKVRTKGIVVSHNIVGQSNYRDGGHGIWGTNIDTKVLITSNTVTEVANPILFINTKQVSITNNLIDDYGSENKDNRGILIRNVSHSTIKNNIISNGYEHAGVISGIAIQATLDWHRNDHNILANNVINTTKPNKKMIVGLYITSNNKVWDSSENVIVEGNIIDNVEMHTRGIQLINLDAKKNKVGINKINGEDYRFGLEPIKLLNIRYQGVKDIDVSVDLESGAETERELPYVNVDDSSHVILTPRISPIGLQFTHYTHNGKVRVRIKNVSTGNITQLVRFNVIVME